MDQNQNSNKLLTLNLKQTKTKVQIEIQPLIVNLRRGFGTSHSFSQQRKNALFTCTIINENTNEKFVGYGECGLPPKKPGCYLSDFTDCLNYIQSIEQLYEDYEKNTQEIQQYDCFNNLDKNYFKNFRNNQVLNELFYFIDKPVIDKPEFRAPQSGLEGAIFDSFCQQEKIPFVNFANFQNLKNKYSHYTAALQEQFQDILESAKFGLQYTQFLKLKFNSDLDFCCDTILKNFHDLNLGSFYTVDANAAWTPEISLEFLKRISEKKYEKVKIVEQPFPLNYKPGQNVEEDQKWQNVLQEYNKQGILMYADESIATFQDVQVFKDYVDGFNFKLDKAGGIRQVLRGVQEAKKYNKKVWIGIMVTTDLGTGQAAQVLMEGEQGDMDGGLLVKEESFKGGFKWGQNGEVQLFTDKFGFGVQKLNQ